MRILVAEDDAKLRSHLVSALQSAGHTTDQTGDGEEALWLLGEHDYDADFLRQVMHNLLGNALRYARSKVEIRARSDGGVPVLTISNDCDPRTMATTGLGLGLRLVRGVCTSTGMHLLTETSSAGFSATLQISNLPDT